MCEGQGQGGCVDLLSQRRGQAVHDLMTRLLGRCCCEQGEAEITRLYLVNGARTAELAKTG